MFIDDYDNYLMETVNSGEGAPVHVEPGGRIVAYPNSSAEDDELFETIAEGVCEYAFEIAAQTEYPIEIHEELRAKAKIRLSDEVLQAELFEDRLRGTRSTVLKLYDRAADCIHFDVVSCTRLEAVRWGLMADPYKGSASRDSEGAYRRDVREYYDIVEKGKNLHAAKDLTKKEATVRIDCQYEV